MTYKAEDIDLDTFLNLDAQFASSSFAHLNKEKGIITPQFQQPPIEKINTYAPFQTSQIFSGPSHQYDQHKQHIPFAPGALANSLAAARKTNFQVNSFPQYGMAGMASDSSAFFDVTDDLVDFSSLNVHRPSYSGASDMDMDFDSPVEPIYTSDFVNPNAIELHEQDSPVPARAEIRRVYPGMHSHQAQQAALAKQKQQIEIQRQQQAKAKQPQRSSHKPSSSKGVNKAPVDPVVEERISRLLNQMRQDVKTPSNSGEAQSPPASLARSKKEEEEMDEDERLLASEEGKKLSSKERRQLRNKVSARAFRSRRKEYIGQLEGEIAQAKSEASTFRSENEALKAENTRLTDLTKLLLSSSAFSEFLNDLSTNGLPQSVSAPSQSSSSSASTSESQQSQPQQQQPAPSPQLTMNTIVEDIDFQALEADTTWNSGMDFSFAPTIYAVTEIPETPILDAAFLAGKSSCLPALLSEEKEMTPAIETAPVIQEEKPTYTINKDITFDESDPAFALFGEDVPSSSEPVFQFFGSIPFEKATETYHLVEAESEPNHNGIVSASTMVRFERLCSSLESLSLRLDSLVPN